MRLVVYGTLRQGEALSRHLPLRRGKYKTIELSGLQLYVLGACPGAKLGTKRDKAIVELWEFDLTKKEEAKFLQSLDRMEGVSAGMYERSYIDTPKGEALVYTVCGNMRGYLQIKDWKKWQKESRKEQWRLLREARGAKEVAFYYLV